MTERRFRADDRGHSRGRHEEFDPVAEGHRYRLTPEVSLAIWEQVRSEATRHDGHCDDDLARARFVELAQQVAARGGRLGPPPFKWTQADVAAGRVAASATTRQTIPVPGKTTQVLAQASGRAHAGVPRAPGRTTLVAGLGYSDEATPEASRGFLRRYVSGGHAALSKLVTALASRDLYAATVAGIGLQEDLRLARLHLANGLSHDDDLRQALAELEAAAEPVITQLANLRGDAVAPGAQRNVRGELDHAGAAEVNAAGAADAREPSSSLDRMQRLFGFHTLVGGHAQVGGPGAEAAAELGAQAKTTAAFERSPTEVALPMPAATELPYRSEMERSFGRPLGHVQAYTAAMALAPFSADAMAVGDVVVFANASPSPALVAHELTHTLQNQRARTAPMTASVVGARTSSAEVEADGVAALVSAYGPGVPLPAISAAPAAHVQLAPSGAAHHPPAAASGVPADAPPITHVPHAKWPVFAATGKPYQIVSAKDPVQLWTVSAWLRSGDGFVARGTHAVSPACAAEILEALGWVRKDRIASAAQHLVFDISQPISGQQMEASAFYYAGLPSARPVASRASAEIVQVVTALDDADLPDGTRIEIDDAQRLAMLRALASFTGLALAPDALDSMRALPSFRAGIVHSGVLQWNIDPRTGDALFWTPDSAPGEMPYTRWLHGKRPAPKAPDKPKLQLHNFYGQPVPGTLRADRELVESSQAMWLEIAVRWPKHTPPAEYETVPMVTPGHGSGDVALLRCAWQIELVGGGASTTRKLTEVAELHHTFVLPPGQSVGTYRVTVRAELDAYFEPAEFETTVEVKSTDAAMRELGDEAFADLGARPGDRAEESFDASGSGDDNHGWRTHGDLGARVAPSRVGAPDTRAGGRAAKREHLEATRLYLEANGANEQTLAAVDRALAATKDTEATLAADLARGWQPFQLRGTYLSREDGVPSGPLALYGTVHAEGMQFQGGTPVLGAVVVQIRDLSRRFDNEDMTFTGRGATFEAALKAAFLDNAKAYPAGVLEIQAEEIDAKVAGADVQVGTSHGKTLGFQLGTDSRWKRVRAKVWDPAVNTVANLGAMALMAFVPGSAVVVAPLLIAYNSAATIDRARDEAARGTLTLGSAALSVGEIALNVLPLLGRAKAFTAGWFALEGANWGGQGVLMTASAIQAGRALQAGDIRALAAMYEELQKLEASGAGAAEIEPKRQQIVARAKHVSARIEEQLGEQVGTNAMFAVAGSVIHRAATMTDAGRAKLVDAYGKARGAGAAHDAEPHSPASPAQRWTDLGLHEQVPGVWRGTPEQLDAAIADARTAGHPVEPVADIGDGVRRVRVDGQSLEGTPAGASGHPRTIAAGPDSHAPVPTTHGAEPGAPRALTADVGAEVAPRVLGAVHLGDGRFRLTEGDHHLDVTIRTTRGPQRSYRDAAGITIELPESLTGAALRDRIENELRVARDELHLATPGAALVGPPVVMAGADAGIIQAARQLRQLPGYLDVAIHGDAQHFLVVREGGSVLLDHRALATYIRKHGGAGKKIRLISCSTGNQPHSIAQDLANKLHVEVLAGTLTVWVNEVGSPSVGQSGAHNGEWRTFKPQREQAKRPAKPAPYREPEPLRRPDGAEVDEPVAVRAAHFDQRARLHDADLGALSQQVGARVVIAPELRDGVKVVAIRSGEMQPIKASSIQVRAGAEATVGDVLAHAATVAEIRRINESIGILGKFVGWWRKRSGTGPQHASPSQYKPGSRGYAAELELAKLQRLMDAHAAEGAAGAVDLATVKAQRETLEGKVAFLKETLQSLVDTGQVHDQASRIEIGSPDTGEMTRAALAAGYQLPSAAQGANPDHYYYRHAAHDPTLFELARRPSAPVEAPALRARVVNGAFVGLESGEAPRQHEILPVEMKPEAVTARLRETEGFGPYAQMLEAEGIASATVIDAAIATYRGRRTAKGEPVTLDGLRGAVKDHFRDRVMAKLLDPSLDDTASYRNMRRMVEHLGNADRGSLVEAWYAGRHFQGAKAQHQYEVTRTTGENAGKSEVRRADLVRDGEVREIKDVEGKVDTEQLGAYLDVLGDDKLRAQTGIKHVAYVFTRRGGALANLEIMARHLRRPDLRGRFAVEVIDENGHARVATTSEDCMELLKALRAPRP